MNAIRATYRLTCSREEVEAIARDIALEQTVEVPAALAAQHSASFESIGRIEEISAAQSDGAFEAAIGYETHLSAFQLVQTLNLVYGNVSMKRNVRLVDLEFPPEFLDRFPGPNLGIEGIRRQLGVYGRPLLATALKPRGASIEHLAAVARAFARGGGDVVKDDHNLVDASLGDFRRRVSACHDAVRSAADETGTATMYLPNISGTLDEIERQVEFCLQAGIRGILIAPLIVGLDVVRSLAERYPLAVMAHPTFSGAFFHDRAHGIDPGLLLGTLFRLAGCDVSIFPNAGGRFTFSPEDCRKIREQLVAPLGRLKAAWPAPAGGMQFESLPAMSRQFGPDAIFLVGGALLTYDADLAAATRAFLDSLRESFQEHREPPSEPLVSACEIPGVDAPQKLLEYLRFHEGFTWTGRDVAVYKTTATLPFRDVHRIELLGKAGEETAFEVRYFEIAPGGYSSREKHVHAHAIIAARGLGVLDSGGDRLELAPHDVAYVPPLRVHQLRNEGREPFGFYCIVDRQRDRPMPP